MDTIENAAIFTDFNDDLQYATSPFDPLIVTMVYYVLAVLITVPPTAFVSAGLTVQNLFFDFFESEQLFFIYHHIHRCLLTICLHSFFPFGHYLCLSFFCPQLNLIYFWRLSGFLFYFFLTCCSIFISGVLLCAYFFVNDYKYHPIVRRLLCHANGNNWRSVASNIDIEFRRLDKFSSNVTRRRLVVTDSWIIRVSTYTVDLAHQSDSHLHLASGDHHHISPITEQAVQFLRITVHSIRPGIESFDVRLTSFEYNDLLEKLQRPVLNARNIVIHQSLSELFVDAFRSNVAQNELYKLTSETTLEACIGCMQSESNVKLIKRCSDEHNENDCVPCYCRPMWCIDCMAKWFAHRQDQRYPETWLSCKAPCPTCRARFCLLDVSFIDK